MAAHYPASSVGKEDFFLPAHISRRSVCIGDLDFGADTKHYIAERGVTFKPGGKDGINQLTVTFFVGDVDIDDDALTQVRVEP